MQALFRSEENPLYPSMMLLIIFNSFTLAENTILRGARDTESRG